MRFTITQPEYFEKFNPVTEDVIEIVKARRIIIPTETQEEALQALRSGQDSYSGRIFVAVIDQEVKDVGDRYFPLTGVVSVLTLFVTLHYRVKVTMVDVESLEQLDQLTEETGNPIILNYGDSKQRFGLPSLFVYDDYIE